MAEDVGQRFISEQRVFVSKMFYQTSNKNETCRRFDEQFHRQIRREIIADIVDRFKENGTLDENKRSGQPAVVRTPENKTAVKSVFF